MSMYHNEWGREHGKISPTPDQTDPQKEEGILPTNSPLSAAFIATESTQDQSQSPSPFPTSSSDQGGEDSPRYSCFTNLSGYHPPIPPERRRSLMSMAETISNHTENTTKPHERRLVEQFISLLLG